MRVWCAAGHDRHELLANYGADGASSDRRERDHLVPILDPARADVNLVIAVESYNYELQLLLTSQGRGLTLAPERLFQSSRSRSRLQMVTAGQGAALARCAVGPSRDDAIAHPLVAGSHR
jgi:DNA-binding transcriptional LysR family regulator